MTENTKDTFEQVILGAIEEIPEAREDSAKLYSRIRIGKTTLAYVWRSGKDATRIDLYVSRESLPKSVKVFSPGRGRARKEGLIATLTAKSPASAFSAVIEGLKVAAQLNAPTKAETLAAETPQEEPTVEPNPADETDADLKKAAAAADASSKRSSRQRQKPKPKQPSKA